MVRLIFLVYVVIRIQIFVRLELLIFMWVSLNELGLILRAVFCFVLFLDGVVIDKFFFFSVADVYFKYYLRKGEFGGVVLFYSFRFGCVIIFVFQGIEFYDIMGYIGWYNRFIVAYYM